jgi:glycosyltransferase involved in cell wall biosynthesis
VATRVNKHANDITNEGLGLKPINLSRGGTNVLREFLSFVELVRLYRLVRPDIVQHVAIKPILYGSIAARLCGIRSIVNTLAGLGYFFSSEQRSARWMQPLVRWAYRLALHRTLVVVQNPDDMGLLASRGVVRAENVHLVRGSGVDLTQHGLAPEPAGMLVVFPARFLWDKGIGEFVEAARYVRKTYPSARFALVGDTDEENPASVTVVQIKAWQQEGCVEVWGWREDMPQVFAQANIVCLPSYREGLPKALIEAAASCRAIVTSDVPGCREIVRHEKNGLLVPPRNPAALVDALRRLMEDADLRREMGAQGRILVEAEFCVQHVNKEMLTIYAKLLDSAKP